MPPVSLHEDFQRDEKIKGSSDRSFGLVSGGILATIGLVRWLFFSGAGTVTWLLLGIGGILVVAGLSWPAALAPLNRLWTQLGLLLFHIVNPIVMGAVFFVAVAPTGLIMRALGKDILRLRRDPAAASYWIARTPPGPAPESIKHQF
ncbi:MAG: hypothetical protein FJX53_04390 [Alphaproteobacteria bacterium]|nr:hypothetical protein [Alphaproteobacteria bacterium]